MPRSTLLAVGVAGVLVLTGCGGGDSSGESASPRPAAPAPPQEAAVEAPAAAPAAMPTEVAAPAPPETAQAATATAAPRLPAKPASGPAPPAPVATVPPKPAAAAAASPAAPAAAAPAPVRPPEATEVRAGAGEATADTNGGSTDVGISATEIKLGGIYSYGHPLGNLAIQPMHREMQAILKAVNDTGGIHGRRLKYVDCDDGASDPARTQACYKKLVEQDKVFSFMGGVTFNEAMYQKDLEADRIPWTAPSSLFREVWQNPFSFPIHMDMTQEALANADWVIKALKPRTYGIICLNNAEMLAACKTAEAAMEAQGAKQVFKRIYQTGTPDMSGDIIAARTAGPEHILHYTVDPTVTVRFFLDAQQQNYWPPKGISGNHMALEVIGGLMGEYPAKAPGGYQTNTTYKLWGADYIAFQRKYAPNNKGLAHHVTQGQWFGANVTMDCFRSIGPNLTRAALVACMSSRTWDTGDTLGQKFMWEPSKRYSEGTGNTHEYMYKFVSKNTHAQDDGTGNPTGFVPHPVQFEIVAPAVNPHSGTGK